MKIAKIAGSGFLTLLLLSGCDSSTTTTKQPQLSDKELVTQFYRELRTRSDKADDMYKSFATPLAKSDLVGATQVALQIDQPFRSLWGEMSRIEAPDLQNDEAEKKLAQAKEAFANCYLCKSTIITANPPA